MSQHIDVASTVRYLNKTFKEATSHFSERAFRDGRKVTRLFAYQEEFCRMINDIQFGPNYIRSKVISNANRLIEQAGNEPKDPPGMVAYSTPILADD